MMLSENIKSGLIDAVRFAAKTEIMPRFRNLPEGAIETKAHADDLVTIADRRAEKVIGERAADLLPEALILGEEAVAADPALLANFASAETSVIIDPVDGTSNFATGLATFGVLLAVRQGGKTVFGLLYDPVMDDWIVAEPGLGAHFVNAKGEKRQLMLASEKPLSQLTGYVPLYLFPEDKRHGIVSGYPDFKRITTLRCSCHEYRMMALGHTDFTLNAMAKPWDHAAGALMLKECGGATCTADGAPYDPAEPHAPFWAFAFKDKGLQEEVIETLLGRT